MKNKSQSFWLSALDAPDKAALSDVGAASHQGAPEKGKAKCKDLQEKEQSKISVS